MAISLLGIFLLIRPQERWRQLSMPKIVSLEHAQKSWRILSSAWLMPEKITGSWLRICRNF